MDEAFGSVEVGDLEGTIELTARLNGPASIHEFGMRVSSCGGSCCVTGFVGSSHRALVSIRIESLHGIR